MGLSIVLYDNAVNDLDDSDLATYLLLPVVGLVKKMILHHPIGQITSTNGMDGLPRLL